MKQQNQKTALVVGMALSGISSATLLDQVGYRVIINDIKSDIAGLAEKLQGVAYINALGRDPMELLDGIDLLVLSPVIPMDLPFIAAARQKGIEVIGEIELGYRYAHGEFVCITGTNGTVSYTHLLWK